jgi:hypothetical protein
MKDNIRNEVDMLQLIIESTNNINLQSILYAAQGALLGGQTDSLARCVRKHVEEVLKPTMIKKLGEDN